MATSNKKKKKGRPTVYNAKFALPLASLMARAGMIDKDMAKYIGIAESTFHKWKIDHPEFAEALTKGKEEPDSKVEAALLQTALGKFVEEFTQIKVPSQDADGNEIQVIKSTVMTRKYIAPNVAAQIFWLKNRKPKQPDNTGWADKQEIEIDMDNDPLIKFAEAMATFKLPEDAGNH